MTLGRCVAFLLDSCKTHFKREVLKKMEKSSSSEKKIDQTILKLTKESRLNRDKKIATKNFYHN